MNFVPTLDQTTREKRVKETDRLAKLMCMECGLNETEYVRINIGDDMTPFDFTKVEPYDAVSIPVNIGGHQLNFQQHKIETCQVQRWRTFRQHAYQALAYSRAFDKFVLLPEV